VRQGRRKEFQAFLWRGDPPDPQDSATFLRSQLHWELQDREPHNQLRDFYVELLRIRKRLLALNNSDLCCAEATAFENEKVLLLHRWNKDDEIFALFNFAMEAASVRIPLSPSGWRKVLNSRDDRWAGPGPSLSECLPPMPNHAMLIEPLSVALYHSDTRGKT
jgi:maltooligosyltrehalose trehalohydrolase